MAHRDLREWSTAALTLLTTALGWILPLVTGSVHISGSALLLLLTASLLLVVAIIFVARPRPSFAASSEQLKAEIRDLEEIAQAYRSKLGPDAQATIRAGQDLDSAREKLASIQYRQAKGARFAAANGAKADAAIDRLTIKLLGMIAIALPLLLIAGHAVALQRLSFHSSISDYYYSNMRNVLTGGLCAIGVLFMRVRGGRFEMPFTAIAGALAIASALTPPLGLAMSERDLLIGVIHDSSITALIVLSAAICVFVFPRASRGNKKTRLRLTRDQIYRLCGIIISLDITILACSSSLLSQEANDSAHLMLWGEAIWLVTFGFACIVRGDVVPRESSPIKSSRQHSVPGDLGGDATGLRPAHSEAEPTSAPKSPASNAQQRQSPPPS